MRREFKIRKTKENLKQEKFKSIRWLIRVINNAKKKKIKIT